MVMIVLTICFSCSLRIPNYKKTATAKLSVKVHDKNFGLSGVVKRNTLIRTIPSWGPQYKVSLELFIRSKSSGWATILAFKASENNYGAHGDRTPALYLNGDQLHIRSSINGNPNYKLQYRVTLNKWFSVVVQQHSLKGKVRGKD